MRKLIALLITLAMALCIAMPAFAADEAQTETTQTDMTEPMDLADTNESEIPEAQEETDEQEQYYYTEEDGYFDYLIGHIFYGWDIAVEAFHVMPFIPIAPIVLIFPVFGWVFGGAALASPIFLLEGIGEILFSPIIAAIDVSKK